MSSFTHLWPRLHTAHTALSLSLTLGLTLGLLTASGGCLGLLIPQAVINESDASVERHDAGYPADAATTTQDSGNTTTPDSGNTTVTPGCNGECDALHYTACTCDQSDPCGWMADGYCDHDSCVSVTNTPLNDVNDCDGSNTNNCPANSHPVTDGCECDEGYVVNATQDGCVVDTGTSNCPANSHPANGGCQCDDGYVVNATQDGCVAGTTTGASGCGSDCDNNTVNACTCASSDPCGWESDGTCQRTSCEGLVGTGAFNDSKDCNGSWTPTPVGNENFYVTSMDVYESQLDNGDLNAFVSGMQSLGFSYVGQDTSVSESSLSSALGQNYTMLYHTGHGDTGMVMIDSYGNALTPSSGTINVQHTIFATCLTLGASWASAFGSNAQTIFGYTKESIDAPVDDQVVGDFASYLRNGQDYLQAWYSSNISQQYLYDRWAAYVREGSSIVEYSARSGKNPSRVSASTAAQPRTHFDGLEKLSVTTSLLQNREHFSRPIDRPIEMPGQAELSAFAPHGWADLGTDLGDTAADTKQALAFIDAELGAAPADLGKIEVFDLAAGEEAQSAQAVGHIVRFGRSIAGLDVVSNVRADQITVLIGQDGVVAWSRSWPQRSIKAMTEPTMQVRQALIRAAAGMAKRLKAADTIMAVDMVWGAQQGQDNLRPAYEFKSETGLGFVVDAISGELL